MGSVYAEEFDPILSFLLFLRENSYQFGGCFEEFWQS